MASWRWRLACLLALCASLAVVAIASGATALTADPNPLTFADQDADSGTPQTLTTTVTNPTSTDIVVNSVAISSGSDSFAVTTDGCTGETLGENETCDVAVDFDPQTTGDKTGTLDVVADDGTLSVSLEGRGTNTELSATPFELNFAAQDVDETSPETATTVIENTGTETVHLNTTTVTGTDAGDFSQAPNTAGDCDASTDLDAGETCDLRITFDPSTVGAKSATANVTSDELPDLPVNLSGTGTQTAISAAPDPLGFDPQDVDDGVGQTKTVTVTNTGTESVDLNAPSITNDAGGDFTIEPATGGDCTATTSLGSGDDCTVRVTFDPSVVGSKTADLNITSDQLPDETVSLTGEGTQTEITATPDPLAFDPQDIDDSTPQTLSVTVDNTGTETVDLNAASITGDADGDFTIETPTGGDCDANTSLGAADDCTVRVTFDPDVVGDKTATLHIPSDQLTDETVSLTGRGIQTELTRSPDTLQLGSQDVDDGPTSGTEDLTITNSGTEDVTISSVEFSNSEFGQATGVAGDCDTGTLLEAGETCTVRVRFDPSATGPRSGTVTVHSNAPDVSADLDGTGTQTSFTATPASLDFDPQDVDGGTQTLTSVVENTGTEQIHLNALTIDGANPGDFHFATPSAGSDCDGSTVLDAGETCDVRVTFDPTDIHARSATVQIPSDELANETIALTGDGFQTELTPSPATLPFGSQELDAGPTATQESNVANTGTETVTITAVSIGGDHRSQFERLTGNGDDCVPGKVLLEGESCKVRVRFNPSWEGAKSATVTVASNAPDVTIALTGTGTQTTFGRSDAPLDSFLFDGPVNAVAFDSAGRTYVGGSFSSIGRRTGRGVKLTTTDDQPAPNFPDVDGPINAVEADGSGGWFVGGSFATVGGTPRANLAHILSDGSLDAGWHPDPDSTVFALKRSGSRLYVGGDYTHIGGASRVRLASLAVSSGTVDTSFHPNPNNTVLALAIAGTDLYVGGNFTEIGAATHARVAKIDTGLLEVDGA